MTTKRLLVAAAALVHLGFLAVLGASYVIGLKQVAMWSPAGTEGAVADEDVAKIERNVRLLERRMAALKPRGLHIIIDTAENRLFLKNGDEVLREAVVSCGSGVILEEPEGKKL